ncbi:MAG: XamI family restriction endonuclease [Planctomycetota bacterium]
MAVNYDKPERWKQDTLDSVDQYNSWFMAFAPSAFRTTRIETTKHVEQAILDSNNMLGLSPDLLRSHPGMLPTLRMSCCPPLAVDRLVGLAYSDKNLIKKMEEGKLPKKMKQAALGLHLGRIMEVIRKLLDPDIFIWIPDRRTPTEAERYRASTIVADRLSGARANPIIKNAQESRQLALIECYLTGKGYRKKAHLSSGLLNTMEPGTFCFHFGVPTSKGAKKVSVSVDVLIQPHNPRPNKIPILIEAKSAGDFTNTNKRRKEEAQKANQLRATYGDDISYVVFLCGYFNAGYLGYEASELIDWIWEHRIEDIDQLGI